MHAQWYLSLVAGGLLAVGSWNSAWAVTPVGGTLTTDTAHLLITLFRVGHTIVSDHQSLINDASKGFKGFTGEVFAMKVVEGFRKETQIDLTHPQGISDAGLLLALLEAQRTVVDEAQHVINFKGVGLKGFVAAKFARQAADRYYKNTGIRFKLTALEYRFVGNKPDDFEAEVLRLFSDSRHPKGRPYSKTTMFEGKPALRVVDPEYAAPSCLYCHGGPKGERDVMGQKKEGQHEGDLAGAISLVMPLR